MQLESNMQMSLAAVVMAGLALVFSLFAAFPGLKGMLSVVRDGVLWLAMLLILSGVGFIVFQRLQQTPTLSERASLEDSSQRETVFRPHLPEPRRPPG